jgi:short-subunit dehydrogenase
MGSGAANGDFAQRYGPWAVIAGGSEGIGSALAERLAQQGFKQLLIARKPGPLEEVAAGIRQRYGTEVRILPLDLTAADAAAQIGEATKGCEVGLFIHNAGADNSFAYFVDRPIEDSEHMVMLNVTTPLRLVRHFAEDMAARGRGGIVLCSAMAGLAGTPGNGVYSAAKAFVDTLAEVLWFELGRKGVDVAAAIISLTQTPAMERLGLKFDGAIACHDPADVADEILAGLGEGPVIYCSGTQERAMRTRALPRDKAVRERAGIVDEVQD